MLNNLFNLKPNHKNKKTVSKIRKNLNWYLKLIVKSKNLKIAHLHRIFFSATSAANNDIISHSYLLSYRLLSTIIVDMFYIIFPS